MLTNFPFKFVTTYVSNQFLGLLCAENGGNKILRNVGNKLPFFVVYLHLDLTNHFISV